MEFQEYGGAGEVLKIGFTFYASILSLQSDTSRRIHAMKEKGNGKELFKG
ncbi:hypothetical protein WKR88_00155 [Trinickia caryophylli]|nr:hypothetical protein [Trinickia caryophylli]WQE15181.1 hypothetical protein U0034_21775 [Trinickia caryophylli]